MAKIIEELLHKTCTDANKHVKRYQHNQPPGKCKLKCICGITIRYHYSPTKIKLKRITISSVGENVKQLELLLLGGNAKLVQQVCKNSSEIPYKSCNESWPYSYQRAHFYVELKTSEMKAYAHTKTLQICMFGVALFVIVPNQKQPTYPSTGE